MNQINDLVDLPYDMIQTLLYRVPAEQLLQIEANSPVRLVLDSLSLRSYGGIANSGC